MAQNALIKASLFNVNLFIKIIHISSLILPVIFIIIIIFFTKDD